MIWQIHHDHLQNRKACWDAHDGPKWRIRNLETTLVGWKLWLKTPFNGFLHACIFTYEKASGPLIFTCLNPNHSMMCLFNILQIKKVHLSLLVGSTESTTIINMIFFKYVITLNTKQKNLSTWDGVKMVFKFTYPHHLQVVLSM